MMGWMTIALAGAGLDVEILGLTSDDGHVLCTLYDSEATWLKDPGFRATAKVKPVNGKATCAFGEQPAGTYAVSFIHDLNDDGDMESNFLGMPKEPWGMTNDPTIRFGAPSFTSASFTHPAASPKATAR